METETFRGNRLELLGRLALLPARLSGRLPDPTGAADRLWLAAGAEALACVREAYLEKARGGTDAAGIRWEPLSERYAAYRRRHPGLNRRRGYAAGKGRAGRPLLSAAEDAQWRRVFARAAADNRREGMTPRDAAASAAALAWAVLRRRGAQTVLGRFGKAPVEIGRDTGRLLASLAPGSSNGYVRLAGPARVAVGTRVAYAGHFHARRPLWPEGGALPKEWADRVAAVIRGGAAGVVRGLLAGAADG